MSASRSSILAVVAVAVLLQGVAARKKSGPEGKRPGCGGCKSSDCDDVTGLPCPPGLRVLDACGCCLCSDPLDNVRLDGPGVANHRGKPQKPRQLHPSKLAAQGMSDQPAPPQDDGDPSRHITPSSGSTHQDLCRNIECDKLQICMLNIQNLPVCRCPSRFYCRRSQLPRKVVCGDDGITYDNDCVMTSAACTSNKKIRVNHVGACMTSQTDVHVPPERDFDEKDEQVARRTKVHRTKPHSKREKQREQRKQAKKEKKREKKRDKKGKSRRVRDKQRDRQHRLRRRRQIQAIASKLVQ